MLMPIAAKVVLLSVYFFVENMTNKGGVPWNVIVELNQRVW